MTAAEIDITTRLRKAWAALPEADKIKYRPLIDNAHEQFTAFRLSGKGETSEDAPHQLLMVKSVLDENNLGLADDAFSIYQKQIFIYVDAGGNIWGTGKYEALDVGWLEAVAIYFEYLAIGKCNFTNGIPNTISIPDNVKISMAADWGTGNWGSETTPSTKIMTAIANQSPDYTIHLGDVYYAGTSKEEEDNLISIWPVGTKGAFTLNSNHEMYSGACPYFTKVLVDAFPLQQGFSFFALENTNWIIVGLDSAYFDDSTMYMAGSLGSAPQLAFLNAQAAKGKKLIVLTHHNGLTDEKNGTQKQNNPLWNQVMSQFSKGSAPAYWYWGHVHTAAVYKQQAANNNVLCRCLGHGAIPWGFASELQKAEDNGSIIWFEKTNAADPNNKHRVFNGFVTIELNGATITENYYDENGNVAWTS